MNSVFDALYKHLLISDQVGIHNAVKELRRFADTISLCGHVHGRKLPLESLQRASYREADAERPFWNPCPSAIRVLCLDNYAFL